jgi:hypothetical protein
MKTKEAYSETVVYTDKKGYIYIVKYTYSKLYDERHLSPFTLVKTS